MLSSVTAARKAATSLPIIAEQQDLPTQFLRNTQPFGPKRLCLDSSSAASSCLVSPITLTKTSNYSIHEISSLPQVLRSLIQGSISFCFNSTGTDLAILLPDRTLCIWTNYHLSISAPIKATLPDGHNFVHCAFLSSFCPIYGDNIYGLLVASAEGCILFVDFAKIVGKNFEYQLPETVISNFSIAALRFSPSVSCVIALMQSHDSSSAPLYLISIKRSREGLFLSLSEQQGKAQKGLIRGIYNLFESSNGSESFFTYPSSGNFLSSQDSNDSPIYCINQKRILKISIKERKEQSFSLDALKLPASIIACDVQGNTCALLLKNNLLIIAEFSFSEDENPTLVLKSTIEVTRLENNCTCSLKIVQGDSNFVVIYSQKIIQIFDLYSSFEQYIPIKVGSNYPMIMGANICDRGLLLLTSQNVMLIDFCVGSSLSNDRFVISSSSSDSKYFKFDQIANSSSFFDFKASLTPQDLDHLQEYLDTFTSSDVALISCIDLSKLKRLHEEFANEITELALSKAECEIQLAKEGFTNVDELQELNDDQFISYYSIILRHNPRALNDQSSLEQQILQRKPKSKEFLEFICNLPNPSDNLIRFVHSVDSEVAFTLAMKKKSHDTIFSLFPCSCDLLLSLGIEGFKFALTHNIDVQPFICDLAENESFVREVCQSKDFPVFESKWLFYLKIGDFEGVKRNAPSTHLADCVLSLL
jgi:hypothetical protein